MAKATSESYTGVSVIEVDKTTIDCLYEDKQITLITDVKLYPNMFVVLKAPGQSAMGIVSSGNEIHLISDKTKLGNIKPRNKEQSMAFNMLLNDDIPINVMTGRSGVGKTLVTLAAALKKVEDGKYKRIILSRPMSQIGQYNFGILPGTVDEKMNPYLGNFQDNLAQLSGQDIEHAMESFNIECIPIQLMRGRSFINSFIIIDEIQVLNDMELLSIGTRVGDGSKIVLLGDLNQRDAKISKTNTGLYKFINSQITKESPLVASIELLKVERSPTCLLFSQVFEGVGND